MMAGEEEHEVPIINETPPPKPRRSLVKMQAEAMANEGSGAWACPTCGCRDWRVTRTWLLGSNKKRLRQCRACGETLTTCEVPVPDAYGYVLKNEKE